MLLDSQNQDTLKNVRHRSLLTLMVSIATLSFCYLLIVPPNAGPEEINHAQGAWYLSGNPSEILAKKTEISFEFPSEITIVNPGGYLQNLACFSQKMEVPASCQKISTGSTKQLEVPMLNRSILYYLLIGFGERSSIIGNVYYAGKFTSFIICLSLVFIGLVRLYFNRIPNSLGAVFLSLTGTVYFFFSVINPSSLEFASTLYFVSSLIIANRVHNKSSLTHLLFSAILLILARSLGGLWIIGFVAMVKLVSGSCRHHKLLTSMAVLGTFAQYLLGNRNYSLGDFDPPWNFYLEELVRVFNGSGEWIVSYFGTLAWSEIRLPLILVFVLLISYISLILKVTSKNKNQREILFSLFLGIWLVPVLIAVAFSKDWPGYWQGRYSLPFLIGALIIIICYSQPLDLRVYMVFLFLSNTYLILLTFARFNWGLYGTNTPIIANGWSFSATISGAFFILFSAYVASTIAFIRSQSEARQNF